MKKLLEKKKKKITRFMLQIYFIGWREKNIVIYMKRYIN